MSIRTPKASADETSETTFHMPGRLPTGAVAGIVCGIVGGCSVGAIVGPVGAALGFGIGLLVGFISGKVMEKDDRLSVRRTRELDAIIGVTEGSLGAGPVSLVPSQPDIPEDGGRWLSEWLTPPPPMVG